ncbi:unnamed protein product [Parnassius apollo]|uniref:(apollo) hypothetical protein n=1 Tax=Parnassius apollo TaxID=110799 RepID=A0A8S3X3D2_PARAO|nr:unnamed protein product [Parnassius apollo]
MDLTLLSSDSDSDLGMLAQLSDSSDEDETLRRTPKRIRRVNYTQSLDDGDFTFRFRLNKHAFNSLLLEITPLLRVTSTRNYGVSPLHQLLLTLRFYALGTMLISVADFVGVSKSTAGRIVRDTSSAIAQLYDKYIYVHRRSADKFYRIAGFPRVLGAIDGTHIRIQSPFSEAEHRYNEAHIKTRNTIERAFGVWKRRFPVVALTLRLSIPNMQAVIIATTVLHNICRNHNLTEIPSEVELPSIDNSTMPHNVVVNDIPTNHRTDLINNYFMTL